MVSRVILGMEIEWIISFNLHTAGVSDWGSGGVSLGYELKTNFMTFQCILGALPMLDDDDYPIILPSFLLRISGSHWKAFIA